MMDSIGSSSLQEKCGPTSTPSGPTHLEYLKITHESKIQSQEWVICGY
jgi:hypothetical protein